jgi:hypothetical protein
MRQSEEQPDWDDGLNDKDRCSSCALCRDVTKGMANASRFLRAVHQQGQEVAPKKRVLPGGVHSDAGPGRPVAAGHLHSLHCG